MRLASGRLSADWSGERQRSSTVSRAVERMGCGVSSRDVLGAKRLRKCRAHKTPPPTSDFYGQLHGAPTSRCAVWHTTVLQFMPANPKYLLGFHAIICSMKFSEYIARHHAFTTSALMTEMDSPSSAEEQLRLAVKSGKVERARHGLLVSNYGRFENAPIDPVELASAADPAAVLSYHSALEAHGVAHNVSFVCQFRSEVIHTGFEFRGIKYLPCGAVGNTASRNVRGDTGGRLVTTREWTVVDCLDRPRLAGGAEEVVRSLTAFVYLDIESLLKLVLQKKPSTVARVGWLLSEKASEWRVSSDTLQVLESRLGGGPYRFGRSGVEGGGWSARWRLVLPTNNEEVASWITHA